MLTKDYLHFFRFVRGADLRVSLGAITELSFTKSHLGKATIYDLLKVRFSVDGTTDAIALYLTDPKAWKNTIEELKAAMAWYNKERPHSPRGHLPPGWDKPPEPQSSDVV